MLVQYFLRYEGENDFSIFWKYDWRTTRLLQRRDSDAHFGNFAFNTHIPVTFPLTLVQTNTEAIQTAGDNQFLTLDQLSQGASTLNAITKNIVADDIMAKTLDMEGIAAAVKMLEV